MSLLGGQRRPVISPKRLGLLGRGQERFETSDEKADSLGPSGRVMITTLGFELGRCPFLALWKQQRAAKRGKGRHKAKPKNG